MVDVRILFRTKLYLDSAGVPTHSMANKDVIRGCIYSATARSGARSRC